MKKTHHAPDYAKNTTADVIKKGSGPAIPNEHWEKNYDLTPEGSNTAEGAFLPRNSRKREKNYPKTNECDY